MEQLGENHECVYCDCFFSNSNYSLLFSPADSVCGIILCCWVWHTVFAITPVPYCLLRQQFGLSASWTTNFFRHMLSLIRSPAPWFSMAQCLYHSWCWLLSHCSTVIELWPRLSLPSAPQLSTGRSVRICISTMHRSAPFVFVVIVVTL